MAESLQIFVLLLFALANYLPGSHSLASTCQHQCDCGFEWLNNDVLDDDYTLRYEVLAGVLGALTPLLFCSGGFITYRLCRKKKRTPVNYQGNPGFRGRENSDFFPPPKRGSTPFSLYGENDDDFIMRDSVSQVGSNDGGKLSQTGATNSKYINIHRSVKSDFVNNWFKNVAGQQHK